MSTLTGERETRPLESEEALLAYFPRFAKPAGQRRVGMECEFFGVERESGRALPYLGPRGIEGILCRLAASFHYEPILEEGHVIALRRGEDWITLEPGGQVELSAAPVQDLFEAEQQIRNFVCELREVGRSFPGIAWLSVGMHPFSRLDEISWVPKRRYELMAQYLGNRGRLAHDMMKRTATNQINLDFPDEPTALEQFRVAYGVTSIASALFANSCFSEGRPNGYQTRRVEIWNETDEDRCGMLFSFLERSLSFRDYVEYLLEMPMIFIVRDEKWIPMQGTPFRQFLRKGKEGHRATWADFELHLSTAFPEARFKSYLEIRGMDAQRLPLIPSVAAFWKGILYDVESRREAWNLVSKGTPEAHRELRRRIPKEGLGVKMGGVELWDLAEELVKIAERGLKRQGGPSGRDETIFLERLKENVLEPRHTPAETLLLKWEKEFEAQPENLIRYLEIRS